MITPYMRIDIKTFYHDKMDSAKIEKQISDIERRLNLIINDPSLRHQLNVELVNLTKLQNQLLTQQLS
jgi:hypothetical protein